MRKLLLLALTFAGLAHGQAVLNNFSQTVKGVTIGSTHCYVWFLTGQYDIEVACYTNNVLQTIQAKVPNSDLQGSFPFFGGIITWIFTPNNGKVHYQLSGRGNQDTMDLFTQGDF